MYSTHELYLQQCHSRRNILNNDGDDGSAKKYKIIIFMESCSTLGDNAHKKLDVVILLQLTNYPITGVVIEVE